MLAEKQDYAVSVDKGDHLIGILSLDDILEFSGYAQTKKIKPEVLVLVLSYSLFVCDTYKVE